MTEPRHRRGPADPPAPREAPGRRRERHQGYWLRVLANAPIFLAMSGIISVTTRRYLMASTWLGACGAFLVALAGAWAIRRTWEKHGRAERRSST